jgi:hypothetical protein
MGDVYFWHIPKTAGTTLTQSLVEGLPDHQPFPGNTLDDLFATPPARRTSSPRLFCGHFGAHLTPLLDSPPSLTVTVLREPAELAWSYYRFTQRIPQFDEPNGIQGRPLEELLDHEIFSRMFTNLQARWLAFDTPPDAWHDVPRVSAFTMHSAFELQDLTTHRLGQSRTLLDRALARLESMTAVGAADDLNGLIDQLHGEGVKVTASAVNLNADPQPTPIPVSMRRRLEELNAIDHQLYELVRP